jgi:Skp family chaperone for outer membrane proteins
MTRRFHAFLSLALAALLLAPAASAGEGARIGVVRIQEVFTNYKYATDMEGKIKDAFKSDEEEIKELRAKIQMSQEEIVNDPLVERGSLKWKLAMIEIERNKAILEDKLEQFKKSTRRAMANFYRTIYHDFRQAVQRYGDQYKFDLIVTAPDKELSSESEGGDSPMAIQNEILLRSVQYISKRSDITPQIVQYMNALYEQRSGEGGGGN